MKTSEQGIALIKQFEGFSAQPYRCPAGKWTIGYGHLIGVDDTFPAEVSENDAENILKQDIIASEQAVCRLVTVDISQNQFDALVSFTYNLGSGALAQSTLLKLLNLNNFIGCSSQFPRWDHVNGVPMAGLTRRRVAEMVLFMQEMPNSALLS